MDLGSFYAGRNIEFTGVYRKDGTPTSLVGASIRAMIKSSAADADASALVTVTTTLTANGQVTLTTGDGVANAGYLVKILAAATDSLEITPPSAQVYFELAVKESDLDEYTLLPKAGDRATMTLIAPIIRTI